MSGVQNVVIVGGGAAGVSLAASLASKLNPATHELVLVSERPFVTHMPAGLRVNVTDDGKFEDKMFIKLDGLFKARKGRFLQARVEGIEKDHILLAGGDTLPYAALILATGNTWRGLINFPTSLEDTVASVNQWRAKFAAAKSVLIVGGGAVGTELAGEVKEFHPNTEVTILHSQKLLLNSTYPDSFRTKWGQQLEKAGVKLVLDDAALNIPENAVDDVQGPVTTKSGKTLQADLIVTAVGGRPNSSLAATLDPSVISDSGHVKVLPTLQVPLATGQRNVFAIGDVIDWPEQRQFAKVGGHVSVIVPNVLSVLKGQPAKKNYKGGLEMIMLSRGKSGGLGYVPILWGLTLGPGMAASIKGKSLVVQFTSGLFK